MSCQGQQAKTKYRQRLGISACGWNEWPSCADIYKTKSEHKRQPSPNTCDSLATLNLWTGKKILQNLITAFETPLV
jgi:hypothetical protein